MSAFIIIFILLLIVAIRIVSSFLLVFFSVKKNSRLFILAILIIFSFGFILSQYLVHSFDNLTIRLIYLVSALGVGLLFYLTIFASLFKITIFIFPKASRFTLSRVGVALATILFFIGVINANFSQVKNISVTLNNLPKDWQGKKIVQISDIHLGSIYGPNFLRRQVAKINSLDPDLIVITGDLFDGTFSRLPEVTNELSKLKAKEGIYFVSGNHDIYLGLNKVSSILEQANIKFLRDEMINLNGLEIIGLDFNKFIGDDLSRTIKNLSYDSGKARLLLNHAPNDISLAKDLKVNLQLSGHSHRGQMFPMSFVTKLIYGKYQYGLHTEGTFNIYTSSGLGSWGPPVRTFNPAEIVLITLN